MNNKMKVFILCGGFGSRLDNEGKLKAKPMVRIVSKPILIHLLETFIDQGFKDFVICTGHKSETITSFFLKQKRSIRIIFKKKNHTKIEYRKKNFKITINFIYTGKKTGTGGRIKTAYDMMKLNEDILVTYGDGLANINIKDLIKFHYLKKSIITITAVRPKERYGVLKLNSKTNVVENLDERKQKSNILINGGYFIISEEFLSIIKNKNIYFEQQPLKKMINNRKLFAYKHDGFWKSIDTQKDKDEFNKILKSGKKPWIR